MARRARNIYKRKDGRYEARFIKGRKPDGKAVYGAVYAKIYADVKAKLDAAKAALVKETTASAPKTTILTGNGKTITTALRDYIEASRHQLKPSTYNVYERYITNYIAPFFGDKRCDELTPDVSQDFVNRLFDDGLSTVTVQAVFAFLKNGLRSAFPPDVFGVRIPKRQPKEMTILTIEEQKRLEETAKASDDINRLSVIICLYTRLRIGELCGLRWDDIDFGARQLRVRRTLQRLKVTEGESKTIVTTLPPKSASSERTIPLPTFLLELLRAYKGDQSTEYILRSYVNEKS